MLTAVEGFFIRIMVSMVWRGTTVEYRDNYRKLVYDRSLGAYAGHYENSWWTLLRITKKQMSHGEKIPMYANDCLAEYVIWFVCQWITKKVSRVQYLLFDMSASKVRYKHKECLSFPKVLRMSFVWLCPRATTSYKLGLRFCQRLRSSKFEGRRICSMRITGAHFRDTIWKHPMVVLSPSPLHGAEFRDVSPYGECVNWEPVALLHIVKRYWNLDSKRYYLAGRWPRCSEHRIYRIRCVKWMMTLSQGRFWMLSVAMKMVPVDSVQRRRLRSYSGWTHRIVVTEAERSCD